MLIVDAQVHIWASNSPERPWPKRHAPHRPEPFSADDLLKEMDTAQVDAAIIVPPGWEGEWIMGRGACEWLGWAHPAAR